MQIKEIRESSVVNREYAICQFFSYVLLCANLIIINAFLCEVSRYFKTKIDNSLL